MERLTDKQKHILQQKLCDMKRRCSNPNDKFYKDYGGRGITVCDEWIDKENGHNNFQKWALENGWSEGCSIDRIDVNGNYEPSNCRWATPKEQANNRRNNLFITIHGETKTAQEWADQIGISERAFVSRLNYGWSEDRLLEPRNKPLKMTKAEMTKEIKMWRGLEEQGLLLRLPCKVGDTVYVVKNNTDACDECNYFEEWYYDCVDYCSNKEVGKEDGNESFYPQYADEPICHKQFMEIFVKKATLEWTFNSRKQFGKTIFLTREEAEKALEMMKGEEHE